LNLKNFLALILGFFFVLTLAESTFAIMAEIPAETQAVAEKKGVRITLGGDIMVKGWYTNNIGDTSQQYILDKTANDRHSQKSAPQLNTSQFGK
jgi:hypothetical protein